MLKAKLWREIQPVDINGSEWPVTGVLHGIALAHNAIVYWHTWAAVEVTFRRTRTPSREYLRMTAVFSQTDEDVGYNTSDALPAPVLPTHSSRASQAISI